MRLEGQNSMRIGRSMVDFTVPPSHSAASNSTDTCPVNLSHSTSAQSQGQKHKRSILFHRKKRLSIVKKNRMQQIKSSISNEVVLTSLSSSPKNSSSTLAYCSEVLLSSNLLSDENLHENKAIMSNETARDSTCRNNGNLISADCVIDNGLASSSLLNDLHRILKLIESERHLVAYGLLLNVKSRLDRWKNDETIDSSGTLMLEDHCDNSISKVHLNQRKFGSNLMESFRGTLDKSASIGRNKSDECYVEDLLQKKNTENRKAWNLFLDKQDEFKALEDRAEMFIHAEDNLNTSTNWIHAQTLFGITTHYRHEADGSLSIKIEGELQGVPLFEQMVVLRECDLYNTWAPFCTNSRKLAQLDKLDVVAWFTVGIPLLGLMRDACYRAVGCDCLNENGSMLMVAIGLSDSKKNIDIDVPSKPEKYTGEIPEKILKIKQPHQQRRECPKDNERAFERESYNTSQIMRSDIIPPEYNLTDTSTSSFLSRDSILETIEIPSVPEGIGHGRMTIRNFAACVRVLSPSSARTKMVVNIDPNLHFLPQWLIDFCMKKICGVILSKLQATAQRIATDPIKNPHSRRMREDVRFYRDWLLPKFRLYCKNLGWQMPPVRALEISDKELKSEGIFESWRSEEDDRGKMDSIIAIQNYKLEDNVQSFENSSQSVTHTETTTTSASIQRVHKRDRLKQLIYNQEHRRSQKRSEKIASARERASKLLQPEPFSEDKAARLRELKNAKCRAEKRSQLKSESLAHRSIRGTICGSDLSNLGENSFSPSFRASCHTTLAGIENFEHLNKDVVILIVCMFLNVALSPLQTYALNSGASPKFGDHLLDCMIRNFIVLFMIALHSLLFWSTINTSLVFAFDTIDFGQKHLAKNLEHGKILYMDAVKKCSLASSIAIAVFSLSVGVLASISQSTLHEVCILLNKDFRLPSTYYLKEWLMKLESSNFFWIKDCTFYCLQLLKKAFSVLIDWIHFIEYHNPMISRVGTKLSRIGMRLFGQFSGESLSEITERMPFDIFSHIKLCENKKGVFVSWKSIAFHLSSFIFTRLGVFIVALLLMSYLLLPKPERKLPQNSEQGMHKSLSLKLNRGFHPNTPVLKLS